jgi:hypothetical protein
MLLKYLWGGDMPSIDNTSIMSDQSMMNDGNSVNMEFFDVSQELQDELKSEHGKVVLSVKFPITVKRYMELFVNDDAPFGISIWFKLKGKKPFLVPQITESRRHRDIDHQMDGQRRFRANP